ncbi:hypothetical protein-transmembrane prediction [Rhodopirellula baltica SH 1]|uniref:Uncharacterized protein n=1 Tax=Rhodopirellula baltica (strain DSM 10527 / NCIMB 13988 / SH1) TaxID=243090 RepID=Q7UDZ8_RHOBA|nr:hypothetical protein-transmembrane prediction [Rhodopirellula baltica SH 1]
MPSWPYRATRVTASKRNRSINSTILRSPRRRSRVPPILFSGLWLCVVTWWLIRVRVVTTLVAITRVGLCGRVIVVCRRLIVIRCAVVGSVVPSPLYRLTALGWPSVRIRWRSTWIIASLALSRITALLGSLLSGLFTLTLVQNVSTAIDRGTCIAANFRLVDFDPCLVAITLDGEPSSHESPTDGQAE